MSVLAVLSALAAATMATPVAPVGLDVASDSSCPTAESVRASLDALKSPVPALRPMVTVRSRGERLRVEFVWPGRGATDVRELEAPSDCAARAQAAAVVVASWLAIRPAAPVTAPPAATLVAARPAAPPPEASARAWWLGLGLGAGAGGGVAPGARVEIARAPSSGHGFGWLVAAQSTLPRNRAIGGGTSSWLRPALALAAQGGWRARRVVVAADLGPLAALAVAWGSGYPSNLSDRGLAFGIAAGLRFELADGPSRPWVDLRLVDWVQGQRLRFDAPPSSAVTADLPRFEGFLTLGWSLALL